MTNAALHQEKRNLLFSKLTNNSVAMFASGFSAFKSADSMHHFVVNKNFYYLTGLEQENIILLIANFDGKKQEYLFIDENDPIMVKWVGAKYTKEEASLISGVDIKNIMYHGAFDNFMSNLLQPLRYSLGVVERVYLDLEERNVPLYNTYSLEYAKTLHEKYPGIEIKNIYADVVELRMTKSDGEVDLIKESIATTKRAIYNVMNHHHELTSEKIANAHYNFIHNIEDKIISFNSIIAAGENGTILHYEENNSDINSDDLLLMDVGTYTKQYASDITRTFPVSGKFTKRQKEIYEIVLECNKKCIEYATDGMSWQELNDYAKNILAEGLIRLGLIKEHSELSKYYYHSIGHSLGLDVHDPSIAKLGLKAGMVITIEPGLYIAEEKIGIRIEDNILITCDKAILLSKDIIKEVSDIEEMMK
ncbi:MAG: aminopeptidase P N-terminal domain-containing protein [Bacilli bacterium]|nr:aminopeptidase P N-terminal domain-containing protein [Bacilli bacterium]